MKKSKIKKFREKVQEYIESDFKAWHPIELFSINYVVIITIITCLIGFDRHGFFNSDKNIKNVGIFTAIISFIPAIVLTISMYILPFFILYKVFN